MKALLSLYLNAMIGMTTDKQTKQLTQINKHYSVCYLILGGFLGVLVSSMSSAHKHLRSRYGTAAPFMMCVTEVKLD